MYSLAKKYFDLTGQWSINASGLSARPDSMIYRQAVNNLTEEIRRIEEREYKDFLDKIEKDR
ncbi:MAG: hypothetical protein KAS04_05005 [Candidatus Aenigmarchaeota archaeon]|nr:hypothetical protein [Candidatus Aenigmarchaeota archaeon]